MKASVGTHFDAEFIKKLKIFYRPGPFWHLTTDSSLILTCFFYSFSGVRFRQHFVQRPGPDLLSRSHHSEGIRESQNSRHGRST